MQCIVFFQIFFFATPTDDSETTAVVWHAASIQAALVLRHILKLS